MIRSMSTHVENGIAGLGRHLEKRVKKATHESQSKFCFAFSRDLIPSNADQECVATALKICCSAAPGRILHDYGLYECSLHECDY